MLKTKTILALSLIAIAGVAQAKIPKNIQFDGYCDGMTGVTKNANGVGVAGTWASLDCAGTNAALTGVQGKAKGAAAKGYIMGSTGFAPYGVGEVTWVVNDDSTWAIYYADGSLLNAGTWSAMAEGVKPTGNKPSTAK